MTAETTKYINFGDENPLSYYGIWLRKDSDNEKCFDIVKVDNLEWCSGSTENRYRLEEGSIDITDDWINWSEVYNCYDLNDESSDEEKAISAVQNYTILEFGSTKDVKTTREALKFLEEHEIVLGETVEDYEKRIASEVFDILNDAVMTLGTNTNDSFIEDEEELKEAQKLLKQLEEEEENQEELCDKYNYELDDIKEYISDTYGMKY
jgi:uncharacterized protein YuzB (UPF0349 family)